MHTIVQRACREVSGFQSLCLRLEKKILITGKSMSTLHNYMRCVAHLALHFQSLPTLLTLDQIEDYLFILKKRGAAESFFKHTVYGMRFLLRAEGLPDRAIKLPSLKNKRKLPVVLSKKEVQELLQAPILLKHRVIIAILYGCGLRCQEIRKLQIQDIDFERNMIHIRHGKGRKDRYVPMGQLLINEIKNYLVRDKPVKWLFNGKNYKGYSPQGIQLAVREALRKTSISKKVSPHTLRHTYATHLLEQGLDIVSIKELLGHSFIETTMVYLHVVMKNNTVVFSPLDTLFIPEKSESVEKSKHPSFFNENYTYLNVLQQRAANRLQRVAEGNRQIEFSF
ncbi:MAG: tyrosine-type recombinase/integrase [Cyclobacteriaceae bacterium]|nr:tyrosine-type recombinase/integrase [Cyclobacteriaceae bacterium]